jgi:hypothetical protein
LEPKPKPSYWGSVLANETQGVSVSGIGDLGGVWEVQLRGVEVVIGLVRGGGGWFAHLVTHSPLSFSYPFPTPKPPL